MNDIEITCIQMQQNWLPVALYIHVPSLLITGNWLPWADFRTNYASFVHTDLNAHSILFIFLTPTWGIPEILLPHLSSLACIVPYIMFISSGQIWGIPLLRNKTSPYFLKCNEYNFVIYGALRYFMSILLFKNLFINFTSLKNSVKYLLHWELQKECAWIYIFIIKYHTLNFWKNFISTT